MANKDQRIKFGVEFDEAAMARLEARVQRFMRMFTGATAKADSETQRRTAEFMASGQGASYMRNAPPGYRYDPLGASASQIYSSKQSQQHFRAQQQYLRTGKEPGSSFTDRAFDKLKEVSDRLDPQRRAVGTATSGLADMVSGGLGSSPSQTISGAGSVASGLLGLLGPVGRFAGGVIGGAAAGTAAGVALGIPGYREYMARLPSQEALANRSSLPQSFEGLGSVLTKLGHDLQMVGSEAGRLAMSFAKVAGATDGGLYDRVRNAGLFARGLGMDANTAVSGFGRAEYMGYGGSEAKQRQFASLLGQTIADGGMMGNSEQVMEDMLKHIQGVEQNTGQMPSMAALSEYASLRASLYQNPALKGPGGENAISRMQAFTEGSGGLWNESLLARAFDKELKGSYDPLVAFDFLKGANMFDSVGGIMGGNSQETKLDRMLDYLDKTVAAEMKGVSRDDQLRRMASITSMGRNPQLHYEMLKNLDSIPKDHRADFGAWAKGKFDLEKMQPGAMGNAIRLFNTRNDSAGLNTMADEYIKASNTSDADKKALEAAKGQGAEKLAAELARVIDATGQQTNPMRDHEKKMADLMNRMADEFGPAMLHIIDNIADVADHFIDPLAASLGQLDTVVQSVTKKFESWLGKAKAEGASGGYGDVTKGDSIGDYMGRAWESSPLGKRFSGAGHWLSDAWNKAKDATFGPNGTQIFPAANASMNAGDYPGEGLQKRSIMNLANTPFGKLIARGEGDYGSFNSLSSGKLKSGKAALEKMSVSDIMGALNSGKYHAVGRYQIVQGAMKDAIDAMGLSGKEMFSKETQDRIFSEFLAGSKRPAIRDYLLGKSEDLHAALMEASLEWASVQNPDTGKSSYHGKNNNKATISTKEMEAALKASRQKDYAGQTMTILSSNGITDVSGMASKYGYRGYGRLASRKGFIMHHTGGGGTVDGVQRTFGERDFPAHYVIDREGKIFRTLPEGQQGRHIRSNSKLGLSNANTEGVEIIAKDDSDVTKAQIASANELRRILGYSASQVYGHGEINPHKQKTEGSSAAAYVRQHGDEAPGMARLPDVSPLQSTFPATHGTSQSYLSNPINATLTVHYANGASRVVAEQPIAGNPATPGMRAQRPFAGHG